MADSIPLCRRWSTFEDAIAGGRGSCRAAHRGSAGASPSRRYTILQSALAAIGSGLPHFFGQFAESDLLDRVQVRGLQPQVGGLFERLDCRLAVVGLVVCAGQV